MSNQIVAVIVCVLVFGAVLSTCYATTVAPMCQPGIVEEMPAHIKKVCMALENSEQLTSALKTYINNEAATLLTKSEDYTSNNGKRTDVDHVFLRFGKRR